MFIALLVVLVICALRRYRWVDVPLYRRQSKRIALPDPSAAFESIHPHVKPAWVRRRVLYLASHLSGCRTIASCFNRSHVGRASVGKSWVANFVKEHAAEIAELRRRRKRRRPACVPANHTWGLDLTTYSLSDGQVCRVLGIIDHGSRLLLRPRLLVSKTALELLGHLLITVSRFGFPQFIRTDNEAMFTSKLWQISLKALGVCTGEARPRNHGAMAASSGCSAR